MPAGAVQLRGMVASLTSVAPTHALPFLFFRDLLASFLSLTCLSSPCLSFTGWLPGSVPVCVSVHPSVCTVLHFHPPLALSPGHASACRGRRGDVNFFKHEPYRVAYRWSPLAVVLIIALSLVSLPNAKLAGKPQALASKPTNQPKFTKIQIPNAIRGDAELSPDGSGFIPTIIYVMISHMAFKTSQMSCAHPVTCPAIRLQRQNADTLTAALWSIWPFGTWDDGQPFVPPAVEVLWMWVLLASDGAKANARVYVYFEIFLMSSRLQIAVAYCPCLMHMLHLCAVPLMKSNGNETSLLTITCQ